MVTQVSAAKCGRTVQNGSPAFAITQRSDGHLAVGQSELHAPRAAAPVECGASGNGIDAFGAN